MKYVGKAKIERVQKVHVKQMVSVISNFTGDTITPKTAAPIVEMSLKAARN